MTTTFDTKPIICNQVLELRHAVGFAADECHLLDPVEVSYVMRDGEGFMKVEPPVASERQRAVGELIGELDAIETTYLYFDRNWGRIRECDRGDGDDEKYVRFSDLETILNKFRPT